MASTLKVCFIFHAHKIVEREVKFFVDYLKHFQIEAHFAFDSVGSEAQRDLVRKRYVERVKNIRYQALIAYVSL